MQWWRKALVLSAPVVGLAVVTAVGFQNCSPTPFRASSNLSQSSVDSDSPGIDRYFITIGEMKTTETGLAAGADITGRMMMVRDTMGSTESFIHASGLPVSASAMAHVHDQPCALGGGGHYKIDPSITQALESNELWPTIMTGADGAGSGHNHAMHIARPEAQSMVIHDAAGARVSCGVLHAMNTSNTKGGVFNNLAGGTTAQLTIKGSAVLVRAAGDNLSVVRLSVAGLKANAAHPAHVHNMPCNMTEGGPHYKQNAGVTEATASAANEMWPLFTTNANGYGTARIAVNHVARTDALSVVIHDPTTPTVRLACVDLSLDAGFVATEAGLQRNMNIFGTAKMNRMTDGKTKVTVAVNGLTASKMYMMHVHDRPCHIAAGGAHYKIDPSVATAQESNEIWLHVDSDATGAGSASVTVNHLARPDAYSVVVHDADGTRLACADLF